MLWLFFHILLYNYIIGPMLFQVFCCHFCYLVYIGSYIYINTVWLLLIFIPKFIFRVMSNVSHLIIFCMCIHLL